MALASSFGWNKIIIILVAGYRIYNARMGVCDSVLNRGKIGIRGKFSL